MSAYLRAPGVEPVRIQTYPKRHRGFVSDVHIARLGTPQQGAPDAASVPIYVSEEIALGRELCYADFLAKADLTMPVSA